MANVALAQQLNIYTEDSPPNSYLDGSGRPAGMMVELVSELQRRVGNSDNIQLLPWARALYNLDTQANTLLFAMARTPERDPKYQWIGPLSNDSYVFYSLRDAAFSLHSLDDARKLRSIGVYRADARHQLLESLGFRNLNVYTDLDSVVRMVLNRRLDAFVSSPSEIALVMEKNGSSLEAVRAQLRFYEVPIYIGVSLDTPASLVRDWNRALAGMHADGTTRAIFKKYGLEELLPVQAGSGTGD